MGLPGRRKAVRPGLSRLDRIHGLRSTHSAMRCARPSIRVARACERAGIRRAWVTPHALRHTHATRMWEGGMRELTLQKRLGHASPESTRLYTRVSDREVVADYRRALGMEAE